jgi:hypothetical protein
MGMMPPDFVSYPVSNGRYPPPITAWSAPQFLDAVADIGGVAGAERVVVKSLKARPFNPHFPWWS